MHALVGDNRFRDINICNYFLFNADSNLFDARTFIKHQYICGRSNGTSNANL